VLYPLSYGRVERFCGIGSTRRALGKKPKVGGAVPLPTAGSGYTGLWARGSSEERMIGVDSLNGLVDLVRMLALSSRATNRGHSEVIGLTSGETAGSVARA
jgi:hypothetical protein